MSSAVEFSSTAAAKSNIQRELESVINNAISNYSLEGSLSGDATQAICNAIEAAFIHGLKDAFFLKSSRYSKYPEPNFWPFVSKYTNRNVKSQINGLNQIRNEVGKARAWIRIVLNEKELEHYISLFSKDGNKLSLFYFDTAYIRDSERIKCLTTCLKALSKINISAAINSSFLNSWTPSPLILAGLINGKTRKVHLSKFKRQNTSSTSLEDEAEVGVNAMELLDESSVFSDESFAIEQNKEGSINAEDEDKSSVYSHPSMLDGQANYMLRPTFATLLSSTPENPDFFPARFIATPSEELSTEVIVHRRQKTRRRRDGGGGSSGDTSKEGSRSRTHSTGNLFQQSSTTLEPIPNAVEEGPSATEEQQNTPMNEPIESILTGQNGAISAHKPAKVSSDPSDSGIEQTIDTLSIEGRHSPVIGSRIEENDEQTVQQPISEDISSQETEPKPSPTYDVENVQLRALNIVANPKNFTDQEIIGTSLQDELRLCANANADESCAPKGWNIERKDHDLQPSCSSSSLGTDFSSPQPVFDVALRSFLDGRSGGVPGGRRLFSESSMTDTEDNGLSSSFQSSSERTVVFGGGAVGCERFLRRVREMPLSPLEISTSVIEQQRLDDEELVDVCPSDSPTEDPYKIARKLLPLVRLPQEKGLDKQEFRCPTCRRSIGGAFGKFKPRQRFRLCHLSGEYFCEECSRAVEDGILPARVIFNWDLRPRPISKAAKALLKSAADIPFIRVDRLNPRLYNHSKQMRKIRDLRTKLGLAVMYLLSCKKSIADDTKRRLCSQDYLYSDVHTYSISDLENAINGVLERRLNSLISFAVSHINSCALCLQKGFICEFCSSERVIYPFNTESTHRCRICYSVFHRHCFEAQGAGDCPKCLRRAKHSITMASSPTAGMPIPSTSTAVVFPTFSGSFPKSISTAESSVVVP